MHLDAITLAAVADEWRLLLAGARIDNVIQPTEYAIAIQCYAPASQDLPGGRNRWLYLSAHPQLARAHITALKPPRIASEPPPFVMLLRKHLEGARIEAINQPRWERLLEVVAGYRNSDSGEQVRFRLLIEVMGRHSNIIFCNEQGMILGSLKRVGSDVNRYRVVAPGIPYVPPPPQQRTVLGQAIPRLEPTSITAAQLSISAAQDAAGVEEAQGEKKRKRGAGEPLLWQLLTRHLLGFSPQLAKEAVYRTMEATEVPVAQTSEETWEELAWNVRDLASAYDSHRWQPQLVERVREDSSENKAGEHGVPVAFAPYVLEQYTDQPGIVVKTSPSMNVLLDDYYARTEWQDAMDDVRTPIRKVLQTQLDRCKRREESLQQDLAASEEAAHYRLYGDLLLAYQHEIQPGQTSASLENYFETDEQGNMATVQVALDPRFDAIGNANRYFNKYHKLRRALELVPEQIEQNKTELATLAQLLTDLQLAETPAEVTLVKAEVQEAGYLRNKAVQKKAQKKGKPGKGAKANPPGGGVPIHMQSRDGFTILIGKNSRQNEEVTFRQASGNDIWLHARGVPGSHVIIKAAGREIPRGTIDQAAALAAYYSQARGSTSVPVDYTLQRHVRHMKGGGPGMVIYEREKTLYAEPREPVR